jgi:ornithine cyclodeaminase/alanine dehydrogenase-like protein (mu-crystallin family)
MGRKCFKTLLLLLALFMVAVNSLTPIFEIKKASHRHTQGTASSTRLAMSTSNNSQKETERKRRSGRKVGFVGCGTIACAIATGLATQDEVDVGEILVSKRSEANSKALQERFPELVSIHQDNQEILDRSDLVFLCVLPQQTAQVMSSLKFNLNKHTLVSLVVSFHNSMVIIVDNHHPTSLTR